MKILFCGDVVGRAGRLAIAKHLPIIKNQEKISFTIVNCDNASGGFGINQNSYQELIDCGIDVLTGGDHIWDQKDIGSFIGKKNNLLRPLNFPSHLPGNGFSEFDILGNKVLVVHLMGQVFMKYQLDCPFNAIDTLLATKKLGKDYEAIFVDFHAEATSEKMAMAHFLDGRVSAVVGSHTHIPTNDCHILANGTAYQTDAGMCGDYNSVIGMEIAAPLKSFLNKRRADRFIAANGEATFCGTIIEISNNGLAKKITPIKIGGILMADNNISMFKAV